MSIVSTLKSPSIWSPAYNPIIWEVQSDEVNQFKFRYVFDVYINDNTYLRYKIPANPAGAGIIDVSSLVQGALTVAQNLPFLSTTPFYNGEGLAATVYAKVGEEYALSVTSDSIIYDGLGNVGAPAYGLYADGDWRPAPNFTTPVVAWASGQGASENYDYMATAGEAILEYEMALGQVANTEGRFLTRCPYTPQTIRSDENFTLTWLNYNFEAATGPQTFPYAMKVTTFQSGATVGATGFLNIEANGGNWTSCTTFGTGPTATSDYLNSFRINMADVQDEIPGAFDTVTLQLFPYATYGTCTLGATGLSEIITLQIDDTNCWGFDPIRFVWLNNLGGRDWYTFIKRNTYTQNATRDTFYQLPGYWSTAQWSVQDINPARWGTTVFKMQLNNTWTASTDWITEEQSEWLRGMFASPSVHVYLPGRSEPTLITITDANYSVQTYAREKLFQYFVSFVEAQPDVVQSY